MWRRGEKEVPEPVWAGWVGACIVVAYQPKCIKGHKCIEIKRRGKRKRLRTGSPVELNNANNSSVYREGCVWVGDEGGDEGYI